MKLDVGKWYYVQVWSCEYLILPNEIEGNIAIVFEYYDFDDQTYKYTTDEFEIDELKNIRPATDEDLMNLPESHIDRINVELKKKGLDFNEIIQMLKRLTQN